jgi:hypothetical protein
MSPRLAASWCSRESLQSDDTRPCIFNHFNLDLILARRAALTKPIDWIDNPRQPAWSPQSASKDEHQLGAAVSSLVTTTAASRRQPLQRLEKSTAQARAKIYGVDGSPVRKCSWLQPQSSFESPRCLLARCNAEALTAPKRC